MDTVGSGGVGHPALQWFSDVGFCYWGVYGCLQRLLGVVDLKLRRFGFFGKYLIVRLFDVFCGRGGLWFMELVAVEDAFRKCGPVVFVQFLCLSVTSGADSAAAVG